MRHLGIAGWSGSGKTQTVQALLRVLTARGLKVSTLKHAHEDFDVDLPGKDSYQHRKAGAHQVLVCSARRWALMTELRDEAEPKLDALLARMAPCDLLLIEGWKHFPMPKLEIWRPQTGKSMLAVSGIAGICAVATDKEGLRLGPKECALPFVSLDDIESLADRALELSRASL